MQYVENTTGGAERSQFRIVPRSVRVISDKSIPVRYYDDAHLYAKSAVMIARLLPNDGRTGIVVQHTDITKTAAGIELTHIAMEFDETTRTFVARSFSVPKLQGGEVLIKVTCCTICGSDLHTFCGRRSAPPHCVLGHEIIGEIADWNTQNGEPPKDYFGQPLSLGQRVTWTMAVGCGKCFFCQHDLSQKCERLFKYGHESNDGTPRGGLSDVCVLFPGTDIFPIPNDLPDDVACPVNCATATVCGAMRLAKQTHSLVGANVLVTGAGMLGLTAIAYLREAGVRRIIVSDPIHSRLAMARDFGSTHEIDCNEEFDLSVRRVCDGRGADIAFDFSGANIAIQNCIAAVRIGGCVLLAGSVFPSNAIPVLPEQLVRRVLTIRGLHNYISIDLAHAIEFLETTHTKYPFDQLVAKSWVLRDANDAFEFAVDHRPVRVAIAT